MKVTPILAAGLLLAPLAAFAGGPTAPATETAVAPPMAAAPAKVDGDWTGFYAGAQIGNGNVTSDAPGLDGNDVIGGVHAGYRYDLGRAVLGAELDYNAANIDISDSLSDTTVDSVARLKLMAGYDVGRALVYVTGGAAYAEATLDGSSASDDGYFAGVGVDYRLSDNINLGGELLGHRFDDFDDSGVDVEAVTLQAKIAYRF